MTDFLAEIERCYALRDTSDELLVKAIFGARSEGIPWVRIGEAMGMTGQGARQHWAKHVEPVEAASE